MNESNEVPTYQPPEGVRGPTLGRDLPDGCERLGASLVPSSDEWWSSPAVSADTLYWWRFPPLKVGDTVQLTGTVEWVDEGGGVQRLPVVPPWYLAQDVWMALGGDSNAFDAWAHHEDDRRTWGDAWAQIVAAVEGSRMEGDTNPPPGSILDLPSYQWVREPPAPPWPGAVLSGLVDEDGVPTWLAQAGQVRGDQGRGDGAGSEVVRDTSYGEDEWVEVRAPRAVPVPETERVPWWEAKDRLGLAGDRFVEVGADDEGPWVRVVEGGTKLHSPVEPDGTVEVLKDGGQ